MPKVEVFGDLVWVTGEIGGLCGEPFTMLLGDFGVEALVDDLVERGREFCLMDVVAVDFEFDDFDVGGTERAWYLFCILTGWDWAVTVLGKLPLMGFGCNLLCLS